DTADTKESPSEPSGRKTSLGLVHSWPAEPVTDPKNPSASALVSPSAPGRTNTGLTALISAYTGIGVGRWLAVWNKAMPPLRGPVKPTAVMAGSEIKRWPTLAPDPWIRLKTPECRPCFSIAALIACATISEVPGCWVVSLEDYWTTSS